MSQALLYGTTSCPFCVRADQLLRQQGMVVEKILVDKDPEQLRKMISGTGRRTVPQIYVDGRHIGGYDDLVEWIKTGRPKQPLKAG